MDTRTDRDNGPAVDAPSGHAVRSAAERAADCTVWTQATDAPWLPARNADALRQALPGAVRLRVDDPAAMSARPDLLEALRSAPAPRLATCTLGRLRLDLSDPLGRALWAWYPTAVAPRGRAHPNPNAPPCGRGFVVPSPARSRPAAGPEDR